MTTPTTFWRLAGMSYVQVRFDGWAFAFWGFGWDVGMLRADWMCALPARPGEGVVCGVGGRSGAERCRGGLSLALRGGEVPIGVLGAREKSQCGWGGDTTGVGAERGHSTHVLCRPESEHRTATAAQTAHAYARSYEVAWPRLCIGEDQHWLWCVRR